MKIQYVSDIHGNARIPHLADILVIAGDICTDDLAKLPHERILAVRGNHDHYETTIQFPDNVTCLEKDVIYIDGLKIIGTTLWSGDYTDPITEFILRRTVNDYRYLCVTPDFRECKAFLYDNQDADIVITHFAPLESFHHTGMRWTTISPYYYPNVDVFGKLWIHGHTHSPVDYISAGGTRVVHSLTSKVVEI